MSLSKHLNFNCETKVTVSESASIILLISKISFFILEIKPFLFKFAHLSQPRDKEKGHAELRGEQKKSYMNIVWGLVCSEKKMYSRTTGRKMEK